MRFVCLIAVLVRLIPVVDAFENSLFTDEHTVLELTNLERRQAGARELALNEQLCQIARAHSRNMAAQGKVAHQVDNANPGERLKKAGIQYLSVGENIGCSSTPARMVARWMESSDHRENLLDSHFTALGIGIARDSEGRTYYTQLFCRLQSFPELNTEVQTASLACKPADETNRESSASPQQPRTPAAEPFVNRKIKFEVRNESEKQITASLPGLTHAELEPGARAVFEVNSCGQLPALNLKQGKITRDIEIKTGVTYRLTLENSELHVSTGAREAHLPASLENSRLAIEQK